MREAARRAEPLLFDFARNSNARGQITDSPSLGGSPPPRAAHGADEQLGRAPSQATESRDSGRRESGVIGSPPGISLVGGDPDGLRTYQRDCVEAVRVELARVRATLAVLFTGAGKTQIGGTIVKHWPGRVLWLAHRDELLAQARHRIEQLTGEYVSLEQANHHASGTRVVVASVQTLRGKRLESYKSDTFGLIVVDEAHHSPSKTYRKIFEHFGAAKIFGITATADRLDKLAQRIVFESVAYRKDIDQGINEGYLTPIIPRAIHIESVKLAHLLTPKGDFETDALEAEMLKSIAAIARATFEAVGDRRTIVFTPGVGSAHGVCEALNVMRPGCARVVDGSTLTDERRQIFAGHKRGDYQYLCNCLVATEGYDDPSVAAIVNSRPTKSRALYTQIAGRGLRVLPGVGEILDLADRLSAISASAKPDCLIVDVTGDAGRHSLISPVNLLDGRYPVDVQERAKDLIEKQHGKPLIEALEEAAAQIVEEARLRKLAQARAAAAAEVKRRTSTFDPFATYGINPPKDDGWSPEWHAEPASPDQIAWLESQKLPTVMTKGQASKLMDTAKVWRAKGLANFKQRRVLAKYDLPTNVYFHNASSLIDAIASAGWHKPAPEIVTDILRRGRQPGAEG